MQTRSDAPIRQSTTDMDAEAAAEMRAAVFTGPRQIRIERVPLPQPGPQEVRVRLQGCGLCASNLGPWLGGPWHRYPLAPGAPGHEGWGTIDAIGDKVRHRQRGERVALLSQHAYAEYDVVPSEAALPLPSELAEHPFAGEPLGCAVNIFKRSRIEPDQTVAIVGIGFLGALLTRLCVARGARVAAVSRRPYALEVARRSGAALCLHPDDQGRAISQIQELTQGRGCERVIEAVGMQWSLDLAAELTAIRGRLVIAGYHQDGPRQINLQQWNWRGLDVINAHERAQEVYLQGITEAIALVSDGRLVVDDLYTHHFDLAQLGEAFAMLQERPPGFLKTWIRM